MRGSRHFRERGFMTLTYALVLVVLIGFTGLAIDVGYLQFAKKQAHSAADAAAMGALRELEKGNLGSLVLAGRNDASFNGYTNGQASTTVNINNPPTRGAYAGDAAAVEAIVTRTVPTFFMMIFGQNGVTVAARSVGRTTTTEGSIGGCIFALNPTARGALSINGTNMDLHTGCSAIVDSNDSSAFTMASGVQYHLDNGAHVGVNGGWSIGGQSQLIDTRTNTAIQPNHNGVFTDPLAKVPEPSGAGATVQSASGVTYGKTNPPPGNMLQPGVYCGGLAFNDTNGVTYTLNPGLYILAGGGLTLNSSAIISGSGVTFYNTAAAGANSWGCPSNAAHAPLSLSGQGTAVLSAPTSGPNVGMLFFDDRSIYDSRANKIVGGSTSSFTGALYFRNAPLQFAGNNATRGYMVLVADTISINGSTLIGNNYAELSNPNPFAPSSTGGGLVE